MRHGKKFNHLGRPASHRKALLANQAKSLILHKRIVTTVAKAKALRKFIEPIITKCKTDTTHTRRIVFAHFQDKEPVKVLFNEIVHKIGERPGGYTRIIKMGTRLGDNAEMCMMELVDYNELLQKETKPLKTKTRRGRGKAKPAEASQESVNTAPSTQATEQVSASSHVASESEEQQTDTTITEEPNTTTTEEPNTATTEESDTATTEEPNTTTEESNKTL